MMSLLGKLSRKFWRAKKAGLIDTAGSCQLDQEHHTHMLVVINTELGHKREEGEREGERGKERRERGGERGGGVLVLY